MPCFATSRDKPFDHACTPAFAALAALTPRGSSEPELPGEQRCIERKHVGEHFGAGQERIAVQPLSQTSRRLTRIGLPA